MLSDLYQRRFSQPQKRQQLWRILVEDFFQQFIAKTDSVLDLACGYGEFINTVRAARKYAVDLNPDVKAKLAKEVTFFLTKSTQIPLKAAAVDKVFISNFFEHIDRPQIAATVKELHRILKPGGKVIILQPNIRFCQRDYWQFFDHITPIDDRALVEVFESMGFKLDRLIERFLPYTTQSSLPQANFLVRLYLRWPGLWRIFGQQSLLVFERL